MGIAGTAILKVLRNANQSSAKCKSIWRPPLFLGVMLWHTMSSELSLPSCLACRWSRLPAARHRPKNVQPVRRHGHLAESSQSAKGGTTPVSKLVAGLWGLLKDADTRSDKPMRPCAPGSTVSSAASLPGIEVPPAVLSFADEVTPTYRGMGGLYAAYFRDRDSWGRDIRESDINECMGLR